MSAVQEVDSLRTTDVKSPDAAAAPAAAAARDPNNVNPLGEAPPPRKKSAEPTPSSKNAVEEPADKGRLGLAVTPPKMEPTPPPPANMGLVVDTSGLRDTIIALLSRLDGHDSQMNVMNAAVEQCRAEAKADADALRAKLNEQADTMTAIKNQLLEESEARRASE